VVNRGRPEFNKYYEKVVRTCQQMELLKIYMVHLIIKILNKRKILNKMNRTMGSHNKKLSTLANRLNLKVINFVNTRKTKFEAGYGT
jgi:hypothetical protein